MSSTNQNRTQQVQPKLLHAQPNVCEQIPALVWWQNNAEGKTDRNGRTVCTSSDDGLCRTVVKTISQAENTHSTTVIESITVQHIKTLRLSINEHKRFLTNTFFRFSTVRVKGKVLPYSLPSVGPGADPGVQAVSPQVTWSHASHPAVGCHYFPPGLRLPSQPKSVTAHRPVPNYTAWWQMHMRVSSLPKAFGSGPAEIQTHDL